MNILRNSSNVLEYTVNKEIGNDLFISIQNGEICVNAPWYFTNGKIKNILKEKKEWIINKIAERQIETIMEKVRIMSGLAPEDYKLERMGNVLGKCENKLITINPNIIFLNKDVIEYVIVHEFCHLKYKTHSKRFMDIVEKICPNYKKIERKLKNFKY